MQIEIISVNNVDYAWIQILDEYIISERKDRRPNLGFNVKTILKYNEKMQAWIGVKNGKLVKIPFPSLRRVVEMYNETI